MSRNPPSAPKIHGMREIITSCSSIRLQTAPEEATLIPQPPTRQIPLDSVPEDKERGLQQLPRKNPINTPRLGE